MASNRLDDQTGSAADAHLTDQIAQPPSHAPADASAPVRDVEPSDDSAAAAAAASAQASALPTGVPFPSGIPAPSAPVPATALASYATGPSARDPHSRSDSSSSSSRAPSTPGNDDEKVAAQLAAEARAADMALATKEKPTSSSASASTLAKPSSADKSLGFFARRKAKAAEAKKAKEKEAEADALPPVGLFKMFRYATRLEVVFMLIGLVFAAAAGATQPLMTLIFARLTQNFNDYGVAAKRLLGNVTPENLAALDQARADLRQQAGMNAIYLMVIGIGMFACTWIYMYM
jgi:ATP-binding cassette subfamily B (MDR/TAP) protein 1